jgi:phosphatidylglycerophosphate synthase
MIFALVVAAVLLLIAVLSIRRQLENLKRLKRDAHVPSDDRRYLTKQAYRRIVTGCLMLALAGMLSTVYLSEMDRRAVKLGEEKRPVDADGNKQEMAQEDKDFIRFYAIWWIGILVLIFLVLSLAIVDIWATRRYAWAQLKRISSEHREVLERDLAMYRQQKLNDRMRRAK